MFSQLLNNDIIDSLYKNDTFCLQLGKVILLSSKLEKQLDILIKNKEMKSDNVNIAMLIKYIEKKEFFPVLVPYLYQLDENNTHSLLNIVLGKSIVNMNNLFDGDIDGYKTRILALESKIDIIATIITEHNKIGK